MSIVTRNVKTPTPRHSIFVTKFLVITLIAIVIGAGGGMLVGTIDRHNAAYLKTVADSYHYEVGKSYFCWDANVGEWRKCTVLGVENNYEEYFVQDVEGTDNFTTEFHIKPTDMAHTGQYKGHTL